MTLIRLVVMSILIVVAGKRVFFLYYSFFFRGTEYLSQSQFLADT